MFIFFSLEISFLLHSFEMSIRPSAWSLNYFNWVNKMQFVKMNQHIFMSQFKCKNKILFWLLLNGFHLKFLNATKYVESHVVRSFVHAFNTFFFLHFCETIKHVFDSMENVCAFWARYKWSHSLDYEMLHDAAQNHPLTKKSIFYVTWSMITTVRQIQEKWNGKECEKDIENMTSQTFGIHFMFRKCFSHE